MYRESRWSARWLALAGLIAACGAPRRSQRPVASAAHAVRCDEGPDASGDVPTGEVDAATEPDVFAPDASPALTHPIGEWPCTAFDMRNAAALALMHRTVFEHRPHPTRVDLSYAYEHEARFSTLARCFPTPGGAWGVVLDPEHPTQWWLRHRDEHGREVGLTGVGSLGSEGEVAFLEQGFDAAPPYDHAGGMTVFDFDGDGEPEIAFAIESRREHGEQAALRAFRYARGRIAEFPTVPGVEYLEDVEGDGRPDAVIVHRHYRRTRTVPEDIRCGDTVEGPTIAARSLPGGAFSLSDPAVRAFNRRECPARPAAIVAREADGLVDEEATARNVVCAGVWGVRRATILAALRACGERVTTPDCETVVQRPGGCRHGWLLSQWAAEFP